MMYIEHSVLHVPEISNNILQCGILLKNITVISSNFLKIYYVMIILIYQNKIAKLLSMKPCV